MTGGGGFARLGWQRGVHRFASQDDRKGLLRRTGFSRDCLGCQGGAPFLKSSIILHFTFYILHFLPCSSLFLRSTKAPSVRSYYSLAREDRSRRQIFFNASKIYHSTLYMQGKAFSAFHSTFKKPSAAPKRKIFQRRCFYAKKYRGGVRRHVV